MNDEHLEHFLQLAKGLRDKCSVSSRDVPNQQVLELCDGLIQVVVSHRKLGELLMERNRECNDTLLELSELTEQFKLAKSDMEVLKAKMSAQAAAPKPNPWAPPPPPPQKGYGPPPDNPDSQQFII